jgi:hypothetical protein
MHVPVHERLPRQVCCLTPQCQCLPSHADSLGFMAPFHKKHRFLWPFAESSIWNTAIGSGARYVPAGIYAEEPPVEMHNDQEWIMRASKDDPLADWQDDSGNFPGLCSATGACRSARASALASLSCRTSRSSAAAAIRSRH